MQTHVAPTKEHVVTSSLSRGWKILIFGCLLLNVLVVVALCFLTADYQNYKSKCSCSKDQVGSKAKATEDEGSQARALRSTDHPSVCSSIKECQVFKNVVNKMKREAIILKLPSDVTSQGDFMNKWTVENRTTNISYSAGAVQIHVEGYYSIYLKMMPKKNIPIHSFEIRVNQKACETTSWKCANGRVCAKATSALKYFQKGDKVTVHSYYINAQWAKAQTIMFMYL